MRDIGGGPPPSPPRLARRLLALVLPPEERDAILADLDDFHLRRSREGAGGRLWYWRQVLAYAVRRPQLGGGRPPGSAVGLAKDLRDAGRRLLRAPAVSVPAVLVIGLALGVDTAVFAVVDGLLLAPLPYRDADELVRVWMEDPAEPGDGGHHVSPRAYRSWAEGLRPPEGIGIFDVSRATLLGVGDPEDVLLVHVQPHLLRRLGPDPVLGRSLSADDATDGSPALVLAHAFWRTRLGADPGVVGRPLDLAGRRHVVVGVARPGFRLPLDREVVGWTSLELSAADFEFLGDLPIHSALVWRHGAPARSAARGFRDRLRALLPEPGPGPGGAGALPEGTRASGTPAPEGLGVRTAPLEDLARPTGTALPLLFGAVTLVLVMACLNVAQMLLARGLARRPELGVRLALGAAPEALARSAVAEAAVLVVPGALLGAAVAASTLRGFVALDPGHLPGWADVRLTPRVGIYLTLVAAAATVVSGLMPALHAARTAPAVLLGGRGNPHGRGSSRAQRGLLTAQTAVTLVLLTGVAVLVRSWLAVQAVDPGFDPSGVHTARVVLPPDRYAPGDGQAHVRFFEELRALLVDHPRIGEATVATGLPLVVGLDFPRELVLEGEDESPRRISRRGVSPRYFETLRIPVLAGRSLETSDDRDAERVVVVNRSAARLLLGTDDPAAAVGRRIVEPRDVTPEPGRIVGVVEDQQEAGLDRPAEPKLFSPWLQSRPFGRMWVAVRPAETGTTVWGAMRSALRDVDPTLPLVDAALLDERAVATVAPRRFSLFLALILGALSLVIAVVGMAGLAAFVASQRRREVAVRVALGAGRARALAPAVVPSLLAVAAGVALGLAGVVAARDALRAMVFGVEPLDPSSTAVAALLLAAVALCTTVIPAWRAGRAESREVLDA